MQETPIFVRLAAPLKEQICAQQYFAHLEGTALQQYFTSFFINHVADDCLVIKHEILSSE